MKMILKDYFTEPISLQENKEQENIEKEVEIYPEQINNKEQEKENNRPKGKVGRPKKQPNKSIEPEKEGEENVANRTRKAMQRKMDQNQAIINIGSCYLHCKACVNNLIQMDVVCKSHSNEVIKIHCNECQLNFHEGLNGDKMENQLCNKCDEVYSKIRVCKKVQGQCLICMTNSIHEKEQIKDQDQNKCEINFCKSDEE